MRSIVYPTLSFPNSQLIALLLLLLLQAATLSVAGNNSTGDDESTSLNIKVGDADVQGVEESIADFFNNSKSKLLAALVNLSSYLPLNVEYAMTDGQKCDIMRYNRPYYNNIPLILAAVLIALGILFTFFGEHCFSSSCS